MRAKLLPLYFDAANERERGEFETQLDIIKDMYSKEAEFLEPISVGTAFDGKADAIVFPQLIGAAYGESEKIDAYDLPIIVLTSQFGTVEMWDWEIVTYFREKDMNVFSPYNIDLAKVILRSIAAKKELAEGAKFLMFQDSPGEGMQANIFKRFFWWEEEARQRLEDTFGVQLIYRSYKDVNKRAAEFTDDEAREACKDWDIEQEDVSEKAYLLAVKLYMALKEVVDEVGGVRGIGANCLNESFHSNTTPCLAWNMLYEQDDIVFACEGDILTMISMYILYQGLQEPVMMTNLYPFLMGMAALAHEKIDKFPDIEDPDNHALGVHCGYFGLAARDHCSKWVMRPKALEIVNDDAIMIDCEFPKGPVTLAKIYPDLKRFSVIQAEIEDYVQYPGSDCLNGALIRYNEGHKVMENLCSHHSLILVGDQRPALAQLAKVFDFELIEM